MNGIFDELRYAFQRTDNGLMQIILLNIICFIAALIFKITFLFLGGEAIFEKAFSFVSLPSSLGVLVTRPWTLLSYSFFHAFNVWHILFNMLWLYWFGKIVHEFLGNKHFVSIFLFGVLAGGVFYLLVFNIFPYFDKAVDNANLIGASAGVTAVIVAAATYMPNYTIYLMFLGSVRIVYIALFSIVLSMLNALGSNAGGAIAHIGGAIIGYVYIIQLRKGNNWSIYIYAVMHWFQDLFKPSPKIKVTYKKNTSNRSTPNRSTSHSSSSIDQVEIDRILDKISEKGYEALSKEEKQKLFNASKK